MFHVERKEGQEMDQSTWGGESSKAITRLKQKAKMLRGTLTNHPRAVAITAPFILVFEAGSKAALNASKVA